MTINGRKLEQRANAGDLKAKKIGNAFRISKEALDDFLKG